MSDQPAPRSQTARNVFRVVGVLSMLTALVLIGIAITDFMSVGDGFDDQPTKMWMFFLGLPFFLIGGLCLNAGFAGSASSYFARQTSPAVRELGHALRGDSDRGGSAARRGADDRADGKFCSECGVRNGRAARFCDACGHAIGA